MASTSSPVESDSGRDILRALPIRPNARAGTFGTPGEDIPLPEVEDGFVNDPGLGPEDVAPPPAPGDTPTPARLTALLPPGTTRQPIANPNDFPWCAHAMLLMRAPDDSREVGSGWIIGPRTIITAGHCVYDQGWMRSIEVRPGGPEGAFGSFPAVHYDTTRAWLEGSGEERQKSDLGVVHLRDPIPGHPGPLRYAVYSDDQINSIAPNDLSVAGFPVNPFGAFLFDRGTLLDFNAPFLHYDAETSNGMSGAPVLHWASDGIPTVIGIHHFNVRPNVNRGIRIGPAAASLLLTWTH